MDTARTARTAALVCVIGTAGALVFSLALLAGWEPPDESPFLLPIYLAQLAGVLGLALTGAPAGRSGRAGVGVATAGLVLFVVAELTSPTAVSGVLYGIAPLLTAVGMVLAGVAVLRSGRWGGWHRYVPLLVGLWVVVAITPAILIWGDPGVSTAAVAAIGAWQLCWLLLGLAVLGEVGAGARRARTAA